MSDRNKDIKEVGKKSLGLGSCQQDIFNIFHILLDKFNTVLLALFFILHINRYELCDFVKIDLLNCYFDFEYWETNPESKKINE